MASPPPSAPVTEPEVRGSDATPEVKPETNGHLPTDSKPKVSDISAVDKVETEKPLLNGTADDSVKDIVITKTEPDAIKTEDKPVEAATEPAEPRTSGEVSEPASLPKPTELPKPSPTNEDEVMKDASQPESSEPVPTAETPVEKPPQSVEKSPEAATKPGDEAKPASTSNEEVTASTAAPASPKPTAEAQIDVTMGGTNAEGNAEALPTSEADLGPAGMSQLAIDGTDIETSPVATAESASDAPVKVAREREDDAGEEPAPKRARTEPKEDEVTAPVTAADAMDTTPAETAPLESIEALPANTSGEAPSLSSLKWDDAEKDKAALSPYQRREIRKSLGKAKKTKNGAHFRDSVQRLWPGLWDNYVARIEKPMDLGKIDRDLREPEGPYATFGDVKADLGLIFTNTLAFNGPTHDVTAAALNAVKTIWNEVKTIPAEEPAKPKPFPKAKPVRESRVAAVSTPEPNRRQSAGPTVAAPTPSSAKPAADARRDSLADADRPKRTVRAPKSKDIDYTSKSRKKLKPELQFCDEVLTELTSTKHFTINQFFLEPVDPVALAIPQYYSVIKKPMDLGQVSRMLHGGEISSVKEFDKNVRLIFDNCFQFNGPPSQGNPVSLFAKQLQDLYTSEMKKKDAWLAKHAKANAPASNPSDDEDDEDEEEDLEAAAAINEMTSNIRVLEGKMREESTKLTELFAADSPDQIMIQVQQNIVSVVQTTLLNKKAQLAELRERGDKPGKKAKGGKSKPSGSKKAAAGAAPKKSGGSKKATKKSLTAAEKDQIANAINDLEGKHLDRAIDIIKNDTGQNENPDGELELDIDQLSPAALLKLWELCKKVLPGFAKDSSSAGPTDDGPKHKSQGAQPKGKKNKPMSAQEQEARIAQLEALSSMYKGRPSEGADVEVTQAPTPTNESSDESSSEEE
ncbi:hypothetical protein NLU13_8366 [Sarocladium strictum]|uniref:Uncharacterized protein n=1 Tax=Sarocladium strictum TaxID=5046 RepID=A0AA39GBI7_SARSR|nr:hypothetical protein NLU13_8366 [Sarocladium strictum]